MRTWSIAILLAICVGSAWGAEPTPVHIKATTLNVWGIPSLKLLGVNVYRPGGVRDKNLRLALLCGELRKQFEDEGEGWDVVFLQEVWDPKDQQRTLSRCGYPHVAAFDREESGLLRRGNGLMILSRFPLGEKKNLPFTENGDPKRRFSDGEALVHKGIILARMTHPLAGGVWLANTHLVSAYPENGYDYREQRARQLKEAGERIAAIAQDEPTIFGGDFNEGSIGKSLVPGFKTVNGAEYCTYSRRNTYNHGMDACQAEAIDHIFVSPSFRVLSASVVLDEPLAWRGKEIFLSDHFGLELTAELLVPAVLVARAQVEWAALDRTQGLQP
jgi:endonuclease/exonuclease/phosphatase family metal-dependent hydrolase